MGFNSAFTGLGVSHVLEPTDPLNPYCLIQQLFLTGGPRIPNKGSVNIFQGVRELRWGKKLQLYFH